MEFISLINKLSEASSLSTENDVLKIVEQELSDVAILERMGEKGLCAFIDNGCDKSVLFDAHIDEIGFVVTHIRDDGYIYVSPAGGIDSRILHGTRVSIFGKETVMGVFCTMPNDLTDDGKHLFDTKKLPIDTGLGSKAKDIISIGDRVGFKRDLTLLSDNMISGKSLDNRVSIAALIRAAKMIKNENYNRNFYFLFSDQEELGLRGAATSVYKKFPDEAIVVDVSFGNTPGVPEYKTGTVGGGAMLGISPVLSREIFEKLEGAALDNNIKFQYEVMGGNTGTNADVISIVKSGVKTGLISIPLRNMHTTAECVNVADVIAVSDLIFYYAKSLKNEE